MPCRTFSIVFFVSAWLVGAGWQTALAAEDPAGLIDRPEWRCSAAAARVPDTIQMQTRLRVEVAHMLRASPTFRTQCHRIADAPGVHVQLRNDLYFEHAGYRARSVIHRLRSGELVALVDLPVLGNPTEWIAHEFEHILEQIEGQRLKALAGKVRGVWQSSAGMYETLRAIKAGRAVAAEV
jgi:hypothetical protein